MKKFIVLFMLIVVFGAFPAFSVDSNNPNVQEKIQNMDPNVYLEIKETINEIQKNNPYVSANITNLESEFKEGNLKISEIVEKSYVQSLIIDILQYSDVRAQIHDLIQKQDVKDLINNLMQDEDIQKASSELMNNKKINKYVNMIINDE